MQQHVFRYNVPLASLPKKKNQNVALKKINLSLINQTAEATTWQIANNNPINPKLHYS